MTTLLRYLRDRVRLAAPLLLAVAMAVPAHPAARTRGDAGASAADFLRLAPGAGAVAQGEAYAGRAEGIQSLHYNPAGLTGGKGTEVMLEHNEYLLDMSAEYAAAMVRRGRWALGAGVMYQDQGSFTRRTISNPGGSGTFEASNIAGSFAGAYEFSDRASLGVTAKIFSEEIDNAGRNGWALDLGGHYRFNRHVEGGIVLRNLGGDIRFDRDKEELPLEFAAGLSARFFHDRLRFSGEVAYPREQDLDYKLGADARIHRNLALRAGFNSRNDIGTGFTFGAGFFYRDLTIDYAYVPFQSVGDAHRISLIAEFGGFSGYHEYDKMVASAQQARETQRVKAVDKPATVALAAFPSKSEEVLPIEPLHITALEMREGTVAHHGFGKAFTEALRKHLAARYSMSKDPRFAKTFITGECWIKKDQAVIIVEFARGNVLEERRQWTVPVAALVSEPDAIDPAMLNTVTEALQALK